MIGKVVAGAAAMVLACCGGGLTAPRAAADCVVLSPGPSTIDGVFADIPGFTVEPRCPQIPSPFGDTRMSATTSAEISSGTTPVAAVFAGELASGDGRAFLNDTFFPAVGNGDAASAVSTEPKTVGGYPLTYFNIPRFGDGYAYARGSTVVIAYDTGRSPSRGELRDVLPTILGRIGPV